MTQNRLENPEILSEDEKRLRQGTDFIDAIASINADLIESTQILTGDDARRKAGLPHEWGAEVAITADALDTFFSIRAPDPNSLPMYNIESAPKGSNIKTKSSKSGFAKGLYPLEITETRRKDGAPIGHDVKDSKHLHLPINDPLYLHTVTRKLTIQELLRELADDGDLYVKGYKNNILTIAYKDGTGEPSLEYIIDLTKLEKKPIHWSRPEDEIMSEQEKPACLQALPDRIYKKLFDKTFELYYRLGDKDDIKPYKIFAAKPQTLHELTQAVSKSKHIWNKKDKKKKLELLSKQTGHIISDINSLFTNEELLSLYDQSSKPITGDQDGLILGSPLDLPENFSTVFNTFANKGSWRASSPGLQLIKNSREYFSYMQDILAKKQNKLSEALQGKRFDDLCIDSTIVARSGCITAQEFTFAQILNNLHGNPNAPLGENYDMQLLQQIFDSGLNTILDNRHNSPQSALNKGLRHIYTLLDEEANISTNEKRTLKEFLTYHLKLAFSEHALPGSYLLPFPNYDPNVHNLIQHGFDTRNPNGCNFEGPTIVFWRGVVAYCPTQEILAKLILESNLYQHNFLPINHAVDMDAGWGELIAKQMELGQNVSNETIASFMKWLGNEDTLILNNISGKTIISLAHRIKVIRQQELLQDNSSEKSQALTVNYLNFIESLAERQQKIPIAALMLYQSFRLLPKHINVFNTKSAKVVEQFKNLDLLETFDLLNKYHAFQQEQNSSMTTDWARIIEFRKNNQPLRLNWSTSFKYLIYQISSWFSQLFSSSGNLEVNRDSLNSEDEEFLERAYDTLEPAAKELDTYSRTRQLLISHSITDSGVEESKESEITNITPLADTGLKKPKSQVHSQQASSRRHQDVKAKMQNSEILENSDNTNKQSGMQPRR